MIRSGRRSQLSEARAWNDGKFHAVEGFMKVLRTFKRFQDPYGVGSVGDEKQAGPILSLVREATLTN